MELLLQSELVLKNEEHNEMLKPSVTEYSDALTYERPYLRKFRVTKSSSRKILLQLAAGASACEQKGARETGGKFKLLVAKRLLLCSSFAPTVMKTEAEAGGGGGSRDPAPGS